MFQEMQVAGVGGGGSEQWNFAYTSAASRVRPVFSVNGTAKKVIITANDDANHITTNIDINTGEVDTNGKWYRYNVQDGTVAVDNDGWSITNNAITYNATYWSSAHLTYFAAVYTAE